MLEALFAAMLKLLPSGNQTRMREIATAIAQTESTREEKAILLTISYYENSFGHAGVPFGLVSFRRRIAGQSDLVCAQTALEIVRNTSRVCGHSIAVRLGWFHTGHCRADSFSRRETATIQRVLRSLPRD